MRAAKAVDVPARVGVFPSHYTTAIIEHRLIDQPELCNE
jgi:hypothetical protein